ncbi:MAG: amino acid ABC transporter permease [Megasphaera sp.]|jgi:putative glutamine transport system permease protein|nr:amino acid ABC transporter permease [Megasphaera sp.]MCH4187510.1 amino acid ABC transporter permease [Megasphaera sp.]MCH4217766.1 amino acid ABC transporter permease [Megasphaera sp.]
MSGLFSENAWMMVWTYKDTFILGFLNTLETAVIAILLSLILGIIFGLMAVGTNPFLRTLNRCYIEIVQNTPLLLQICMLYYALAFSGHKIGILLTGIISLSIYHGAYMAEVFRAGIGSIPKGQFEAADAQGFSYIEKMYYIILPQSIKIILPPSVNQIVNLIKNTSVLYIIGGSDLISLTYNFVTGATTGGAYAPAYLICGVLFFVLCFPLTTVAGAWEGKLKKKENMFVTDKKKVADL